VAIHLAHTVDITLIEHRRTLRTQLLPDTIIRVPTRVERGSKSNRLDSPARISNRLGSNRWDRRTAFGASIYRSLRIRCTTAAVTMFGSVNIHAGARRNLFLAYSLLMTDEGLSHSPL